jgi:hypothetical protein
VKCEAAETESAAFVYPYALANAVIPFRGMGVWLSSFVVRQGDRLSGRAKITATIRGASLRRLAVGP